MVNPDDYKNTGITFFTFTIVAILIYLILYIWGNPRLALKNIFPSYDNVSFIIIGLLIVLVIAFWGELYPLEKNLQEGYINQKTLKTIEISFATLFSIFAIVMLIVGVSNFNKSNFQWLWTYIPVLIGGFILLIIPLNFSLKNKSREKEISEEKEEEKHEQKILEKLPKCPETQEIPKELLEKIRCKLNDYYVEGVCKHKSKKECNFNYLFEQLSNPNKKFTFEMVDQYLNEMSQDALQNQAIYLLFQLLRCRLELKAKAPERVFGTKLWWEENMIETSPILKYTYVIAAVLCFGFLLYYFFGTYKSWFDLFGKSRNISSIIYLGILLTTIIGYLYAAFKFGFFAEAETPSPTNTLQNVFGGTVGTLVGAGIILFIVNAFFGDVSFLNKSFALILIGLLIVFNIYYMFLVPQLVIIGIILQKYILQTPTEDEDPIFSISSLVKVLTFIIVLFASFFSTTYQAGDLAPGEEEVKTTYNKPVWFIFGLLCMYLVVNIVDIIFFDHYFGEFENNWSILLMPLVNVLIRITTNDNLAPEYDELSVVNTY